jgi:hypothetical protein
MPAVFINYRTGDEDAGAALIERELSRPFGSAEVFRASKSIRPGDDFEREILMAVRRSHVLLAVIGHRWLTASDGNGGRALDRESDWIRREISEAFAHHVRVIPVLVGDIRRLDAAALPAVLQPLAKCQYVRLNYRSVDTDIGVLVTTLARLVPSLRSPCAEGRNEPGGTNRVTNHFHQSVDAQFANFGIKS